MGVVEAGVCCVRPLSRFCSSTCSAKQKTCRMDRLWVAAFLAAIALPGMVLSQPACTGDQVYNRCGTACPPTCENPNPAFCTRQCVAGCFCPHDMYRNSNRDCVTLDQCSAVTTEPPAPACSGGKEFVSCLNTCPATCDDPTPPLCTSLVCISGCECPRGKVLHNDRCVPPTDCPSKVTTTVDVATPTQGACTNNMVFKSCGTACPITCQNFHSPPFFCQAACVQGCFCPTGLVQNGDRCVPSSECPDTTTDLTTPPPSTPSVTPPTPSCTNNLVYSMCGSSCPTTCQNVDNPLVCITVCATGCFCPSGLILDGDRCVTRDQCSGTTTDSPTPPPSTPSVTPPTPSCTNNLVYSMCGSSCPTTCQNVDNPPACIAMCATGCFCPSGLILDGDRCVTRDQCSAATTTTIATVETTPTPTCPTGMVYKSCGPICRQTCSPNNFCFSLRCAPGCFCPDGTYEHEGACLSECPTSAPTEVETTAPLPTEPVCTNGRVFSQCASACPDTCSNIFGPPRPCPLYCRQGCVCPRGLVEDGDRCVDRSQCRNPCDTVRCPSRCVVDINGNAVCAPDCRVNNGNCSTSQVCTPTNYTCSPGRFCNLNRFVNCTQAPPTGATVEPTSPVCASGMSFNRCGTRCPLTCQYPDPRPCVRICQPGCFCPQGLLENNGTCVKRSDCPRDACSSSTCSGSNRCVASNVTGQAKCIPSCENNGGCSSSQECVIRSLGCAPGSREACDSTFFRECRDVPFVPCRSDAFLACDSEFTYCLQQNVSRRASCVGSCLSRNGNCPSSEVCITNITTGSPRLQCLKNKDLPSNCPAGQVMSQCGNACQVTCDTFFRGPLVCPAVCGPPACVCPRGLVLFRDRCVDPKLCYVLTKYPPVIQPLPVVNDNSVLLSLTTQPMTQVAFETARSMFLTSVQNTLNSRSDHQVHCRLHGVYHDTTANNFVIVVEVTGDSISRENAQMLANILQENAHLLVIQVNTVQPQEVIYVEDDTESDSQGLSNAAIIGIAVGSAGVGMCFVVVWIALVACCCVVNRRLTTKACRAESPSSEKAFVFSDIVPGDNDFVADPVDNKGKLVKESLMY